MKSGALIGCALKVYGYSMHVRFLQSVWKFQQTFLIMIVELNCQTPLAKIVLKMLHEIGHQALLHKKNGEKRAFIPMYSAHSVNVLVLNKL